MLGAVLADIEVVDNTSSVGDWAELPLLAAEGLISGVLTGGEEASEAEWLLEEGGGESLPLSISLLSTGKSQPASPARRTGESRDRGQESKGGVRGVTSTHENLPAASFATAAAIPPLCSTFFLCFSDK